MKPNIPPVVYAILAIIFVPKILNIKPYVYQKLYDVPTFKL